VHRVQASIIRIGTRGSPLALIQAHEARDRLMAAHGLPETAFAIVTIRTSGDRIQDRSLAEAGGKGLFTKEIEEALLSGTIDLAVHSMKDMPTVLPDGLEIASILPREDARDAFVSLKWPSLAAMPAGAVVGTSSLRRAAQVRRLRPDLTVVPFRGNVETRLRKLADGVAEATLLAVSGLNRLGMEDRITSPVDVAHMLPAVAQGAIGIEVRSGDVRIKALLPAISDADTALCLAAERAFLARLEGSCRTPIAGYATRKGDSLSLAGQILTPDGAQSFERRMEGPSSEAEELGIALAEALLAEAGSDFFAFLTATGGP
jgi:hydroxymethylbilane synthase